MEFWTVGGCADRQSQMRGDHRGECGDFPSRFLEAILSEGSATSHLEPEEQIVPTSWSAVGDCGPPAFRHSRHAPLSSSTRAKCISL